MKILVLNGPNLNFLGIREPEIYGNTSYDDLCKMIETYAEENEFSVEIYQSNYEGKLIDLIQYAYFEKYDGIVINAGAYTHTSIAIRDAIASINIPVVGIHISDISKRESFRQVDYLKDVCKKSIIGHGIKGYIEALDYLVH